MSQFAQNSTLQGFPEASNRNSHQFNLNEMLLDGFEWDIRGYLMADYLDVLRRLGWDWVACCDDHENPDQETIRLPGYRIDGGDSDLGALWRSSGLNTWCISVHWNIMVLQLIQSLAPREIQSSTMQLNATNKNYEYVRSTWPPVGVQFLLDGRLQVHNWGCQHLAGVYFVLFSVQKLSPFLVHMSKTCLDTRAPGHVVPSYLGCLLEKEHPEGDGLVMTVLAWCLL